MLLTKLKKEKAKRIWITTIRDMTGCSIEEAEQKYKEDTKNNIMLLCIFLFILFVGMWIIALYL